MKIKCRNCGADNFEKWNSMKDSGFAIWHIECCECGQQALAEDDTPASMGRKGGAAKTAKKKASSAANGKKGGRPYLFMVRKKINGMAISRHATEAAALKKIRAENSGRDPIEIVEYSEKYWHEMR
jgi:hypothetical protein